MQTKIPSQQKTAYILMALLAVIAFVCVIWICFDIGRTDKEAGQLTADIYQNGVLIQSIDLNAVTESYRFTVTGDNDCRNEIEVRPGSIGMVSADCPDKLCVHQGFIHSSMLPITCLPNRLVIQIRAEEITTDIITY